MPFFKSEGVKMLEKRGYVFQRKLGEGAYSKVWLTTMMHEQEDGNTAEKDKDMQPVSLACKIIDTRSAERRFVTKFLPRELDILPKLKHPHLVHCHGIYQVKAVFYIFTSFAEKGDLLDYVLKHGHLEESHARVWASQLAMGIHFLHQLDIAHRDIKCENILITARNNLKLADFGFARFLCDAAGEYRLSRTFCGSLAYAAPEVLKADKYDGKGCDIWSYGVVVFVMLNQVMPFRELSVDAMYLKQTRRQWKFRPAIANTLSTEAIKLVSHLLDPNPDDRHTIEDVINDLWFLPVVPLMTDKIKTSLNFAQKNRQNLLPESVRIDLPVWDRKHNKDIVRLTELTFEPQSETMVVPPKKRTTREFSHLSLNSGSSGGRQSLGSASASTRGSSVHNNVMEDLLQRNELCQQPGRDRESSADDDVTVDQRRPNNVGS
ncbi:testis-specific serine/threonine-protein kinase 6 isoform X1 [Nilaparvata lugens]|uniref:testis-specific serine/threonine-protein kinase 6 isoform X2 n=1 Tax=Nilaparvata lugens TaxID=108931 RepID=UPI00193CEDA6|nr:testis-specific serine/threonine-protein kinase 6 isoform X2 [Nilaparvata lugens]XP_039275387.1 testis-specific serine/threonine-protein kinase 6 isoform X1 [Nilaparvata lugens]